jgi:phosphoribosyl 1,2-cyclic phosphodiesterase
MSLFIASIASGSNGNCYYIGNKQEAVLVDAGVSCREIEKRMKRLNLSIRQVKAIFISHEHSDHIRGLEVLSRKNSIPVYITPSTLRYSGLTLDESLLHSFSAYDPVSIGGLSVVAFPKLHDAADPFSFIIEHEGVRVGVLTDIGSNCRHVIHNFRQCHAAFLETNYDEQMLEEGSYPFHLKKRIRGDKGHLSNHQALELFLKHRSPQLSHLFLSHLSKNNNTPELAQELFAQHAGTTNVVVASRNKESEVYAIYSPLAAERYRTFVSKTGQMSLF